jgi:hypothetical protein
MDKSAELDERASMQADDFPFEAHGPGYVAPSFDGIAAE